MPSGLRKTTGNHFEIYYEEPWGGVASNKSSVDIDPNQCITQDGVVLRNGLMCYSNIASQNSKWDLELIPPTTPPSDPPILTTLDTVSCILSDYLGIPWFALPTVGSYATGTFTVPDSTAFIPGQTFIFQYTQPFASVPTRVLVTVGIIIDSTHISGFVNLPVSSFLPFGGQFLAVVPATTPIIGTLLYYTHQFSIPVTPINSASYNAAVTPVLDGGVFIGATFNFTPSPAPTTFYAGCVFYYYNGDGVDLSGYYTCTGPVRPDGLDWGATCVLPATALPSTVGDVDFYDYTIPFPFTPGGYWVDAVACLIFNCANYLCAVDQYGNAYIATLQTDGTIKFQFDLSATDGPTLTHGLPVAVKVVAGVAYISVYSTSTLYAYTPRTSYVVATTYTAGQFIDILDEYMLQLNCNSTVDGVQPTLVSWSSPDAFSTWDPAVNRTAGFQLLTSVEDYISGFIAVDNVGYILKRTGVTQITATGVAIGPWNFTTYWNSTIGQGLIFPYTLKQFGRYVFLATDSDIYTFYGGMFTSIGAQAKAAIFSSFNTNPALAAVSNNLITAGVSIYPFNDSVPGMEYVFIAATSNSVGNIVFWFYNPALKAWTSVTRTIADLLGEFVTGATNVVVNSIQTASVFLNALNPATAIVSVSNLPVLLVYINFSYTVGELSVNKTFIYYNLVNTPTADTTDITLPPGNLNLVFRSEEIKLGFTRKCTIRRAVVKAYGTGTLACTITDVEGTVISLGNITLDGTNNQKTYYTPFGIATVEAPKLSITSTNFNGAIVKVMLAGTYADGEID